MTRSAHRSTQAGYQLRVSGHLDQHWSAWFGDLELIDASYPYEHVRETCENPIVRP